MKTIIAGPRYIDDYKILHLALQDINWTITEVVSGCANGVDQLGEKYANTYDIPIKRFPADWDRYDKRAGYLRNKEMAEYADALLAIWDQKSKGTGMMIKLAEEKDLMVVVFDISNGAVG